MALKLIIPQLDMGHLTGPFGVGFGKGHGAIQITGSGVKTAVPTPPVPIINKFI
jgi:hypothetical protein